MASPDFRNYIDLTIYDVEPEDIYADAVNYARTALPEFTPRVGTVEDALLQAVCYSTATTVAAINRLPDGLMEGIARLLGVTRNEATFATGSVFIDNYLSDQSILVPQGTLIEYAETVNGDLNVYLFATSADVVIDASSTTMEGVPIVAVEAGLYPAILDGQSLNLVTPISGAQNIVLYGNLLRGANAETNEEYFNRAASHLASLSGALANQTHMANYIRVNYQDMPNFKVWDLTDILFDATYPGADTPGVVSIVGCASDGGALPNDFYDALVLDLQSKSVAGLTFRYQNLNVEELPISIYIYTKKGYTESTVVNAAIAKLNDYFSLANFKYRNIPAAEIIAVVSSVAGVAYVDSIDSSPYMGVGMGNDGVGNLTYQDKTYALYMNASVGSQGIVDFG